MMKLIKKSLLSVVLSCVMIFSVACKNNDNKNNNNLQPTSYTIDTTETLSLIDSLSIKVEEFIAKINNKNVLENENLTPNIISNLVTILNDSYKADIVCGEFEEDSFELGNLYAHKTNETDEFVSVKAINDEKLLLDLVSYTSVSENNKNCELFENYIYEINVDKGNIKSLKIRNLIANDSIQLFNNINKIEMYEFILDFENEVLDVFYAKPIQHNWMLNNQFLNEYLKENMIDKIMWGSIYSAKIDLKANSDNIVESEICYDDISETLKNKVLNFDCNKFYNNLTLLAANDDYEDVEELFDSIKEVFNISYDYTNEKFAITD